MARRSIPVYCERCGHRFELDHAAPGERDLGLDRIKSEFRYCAGCQSFVGRTCCWNADAVACTVCAPPFALVSSVRPDGLSGLGSHTEIARRGLTELAASIDAVEQVRGSLTTHADSGRAGNLARLDWDHAWWTTGWLIAQAEASRDAAAKALWNGTTHPDASAAEQLRGQLASLIDLYRRARLDVEARMVAVGESLARAPADVPLVPLGGRFPRRRALGAGTLAAVAVLAFGTAALLQVGYLRPFSSPINAIPTDLEGGVLGGAGQPSQKASPSSPPPPEAQRALIADLDFNDLPVGELLGVSEEISPVAGRLEVVAFPTPFDRSIRFASTGRHQFCLPNPSFDDGRIWLDMDLYLESQADSGRLLVSLSPPGAEPTAASIPLELLGGLAAEEWHRLRVWWAPGGPVTLSIGEGGPEEMQTMGLPPAGDEQAVSGAVCVAALGMKQDAELLLDNVRIEQ